MTGLHTEVAPTVDFDMLRSLLVFGATCLLTVHSWAQTPSFDCAKAQTPAEKAICADPALAAADRQLDKAYAAARSAPGADLQHLHQQQIQWIIARNKNCHPDPDDSQADPAFLRCLNSSYVERIAQLAPRPDAPAACQSLAGILRSVVTHDPRQSIVEAAALVKGSALKLDDAVGQGYETKSEYEGSLGCQGLHLFRTQGGQKREVTVADGFGPEEGAHCGLDHVHLVSVNGAPGLLQEEHYDDGLGPLILSLSLRDGENWTKACSIKVLTETQYNVAFSRCAGTVCPSLGQIAVQAATMRHRAHAEPSKAPPPTGTELRAISASLKSLSPTERLKKLNDLNPEILTLESILPPEQELVYKELATRADIMGITASTYLVMISREEMEKAQTASGCYLSYTSDGATLFPVSSGNEVLVGKIGTDGVGLSRYSLGPDDAVAFYRRSGDGLEPAAAFCVRASGRAVRSAAVMEAAE